ncbi:mannose-1-phosphate guanylyltransferase/mannose-6-phosphate isomerase [Parvibium lacunae]|uniref:mannose-1-phosphate guanylyltransferase n=1 Tax=Parvibium lacunae TaxID=1888893 RepID=A0A368L1L0_9BURK|nr:mannose-1-phosphate guanylyltransferase/mannose-6-phosphate isomerase [Parvibium lacunae]RCS57412.1 mannose-1-phosphate guanylyltransferase/mannose-6-phosphate isomerase [Parvibium lacunae]
MTNISIQQVVLSGGSGTRLWPLSRAAYPKQFLAFDGPHTLLQQALLRLHQRAPFVFASPLVVASETHRFLVLDQLREIKTEADLILEPQGKNTAPALTLAALYLRDVKQTDPVMIVMPADQAVAQENHFEEVLFNAARLAAEGQIVLLGVPPDRVETGYGYIQGKPRSAEQAGRAYDVLAFKEKPDFETARAYLEQGNFFWNSGIFILKATRWLALIEQFHPEIYHASLGAMADGTTDGAFFRPDPVKFGRIPAESIDYAVIERCLPAGYTLAMLPLAVGWSDLGSWDALWRHLPHDGDGNAQHGDVLLQRSQNCLVHASNRLVAVSDQRDLVVIETADAVLVASRAESQAVKTLVATLQAKERVESNSHTRVHRPWGWYETIDQGPRFQVKRIMVKPHASLSLQLHQHRAEHWVVVSGTATVVNGEQQIALKENQSTYIPVGQKHRLSNQSETPLEIIEVQSGDYLGEDDIIRLDDLYGR